MGGTSQTRPRRRLTQRELIDALAAKTMLSERCFARAERGPLAPFVLRRRIRALQSLGGNQIHAIGIGRKFEAGKPTNKVAVRIYVTQKLPKNLLDRAACIPEEVDGIATDIIEAPPAYFAMPLPACTIRRARRQRPLRPGTSIGNAAVSGGTLAARCTSARVGEGGLKLVLSNNHVLADFGAAAIGSAIYQPSPQDGGDLPDTVAQLLRFVPIVAGEAATNRVDAAVATILPGIDSGIAICTVGGISGIGAAVEGMQVHKHARTTGYSIGVVDDLSYDVLLPISRTDLTRVARFVGQIRIRASTANTRFAQGGDSGALIVSKAGNLAVGMLFACPDDGSYACANPIHDVVNALNIVLE